MPWKANETKQDMIEEHGQTAGLPLFASVSNSHSLPLTSIVRLPDWIWTGSGIKAEVYNLLKEKFAEDSVEYLKAMMILGGSATDNEVVEYFDDRVKWPPSTVSARRNYWRGSPYYIIESYPDKKKLGPRRVPNTIWYINFSKIHLLLMEGS